MEQLNINQILDRKKEEQQFIDCITNFESNKNNVLVKRGVYIYGAAGSGKTTFVKEILKKLNYDVVLFDAGDIRNKSIIETITNHNMSEASVISMFSNKSKKIAIIMDEIDGMNGGDKGGINSLIKLIRPKKTKKQKKENISMSPIICIGNYHVDKKITEMMKVCVKIEINTPTSKQIHKLIDLLMPNLDSVLIPKLIQFIQGDLRKLQSICDIYNKQQVILQSEIITNMKIGKKYTYNNSEIFFKKIEEKSKSNFNSIIAHFEIKNENGKIFELKPEIRIYNQPVIITSEADIKTTLLEDKFLVMNLVKGNEYFNVRYQEKPFMIWIWISVLLISLGGLMSFFKKQYEK